jgi:putative RecB family exonuclease
VRSLNQLVLTTPKLDWLHHCWEQNSKALSPAQVEEGLRILENYYNKFIAGEVALHRPLAVEGNIQGTLRVQNLEFKISGRCDRIDYVEDGLELIDYKSTREVKLPNPDEIDLQIGLYYLTLEQRYRQSLQKLSLVYLRTGDKVSFDATPEHKQLVEATISELAFRLRTDDMWEATTGEHCDRCTYARYCGAVQEKPEPLPETAKSSRQMQLVLSI